jgi:hypothetical protein
MGLNGDGGIGPSALRICRGVRDPALSRPCVGVLRALSSSGCLADLPRNVARGIPKVAGGRTIVLLETIHIAHPNMRRRDAMEYWILLGQFVSASEGPIAAARTEWC